MTMVNLLLISLILVYITDISGALEDLVEPSIARILKRRKVRLKKPWNCSRCQTFWLGLLYLLITWNITIPYIAYVCLLSMLTPFFNNLLLTILDLLIRLTNK